MKKPKIAALGGGTGLSTLLRGLKKYDCDITAIVNVADDGGSSGRLKKELGILPPGDIRNCLVALSEEESLMSRLFQYRFSSAGSLSGHSFGNLFLTAMTEISGGFDNAVARSEEVLAIRGRVLPVTLSQVTLEAELENGEKISGETKISRARSKIKKITLNPKAPPAAPKVLDAIKEADVIILGPGSLYTSIIVNFLVGGIIPAVKSSRAYKIYVSNIMTQPGETSGFDLSDHIKAIEEHSYKGIVDCVIINSAKIPDTVAARYKKRGSYQVKAGKTGIKTVKSKLFSNEIYARHDSRKLACAINKIIEENVI